MPENAPPALPPLDWLRVFDAAARHGNFTAAARELGLTQAAVSQRIRNLEARIGADLFERLPRGVRLTVDGEAYAPHVRTAIEMLQRSTGDLFATPRRSITVAASTSVIELWVAPRLSAIRAAAPSAQVSLVTFHRASELDPAKTDLDVRFGDGRWPGRQARKLFDEILAPVAAPGCFTRSGGDWRQLPLIAVSGPRDGWADWAVGTGVAPPPQPGLRVDTFAQARAAALCGAGVMLGSLNLLDQDLSGGTLVRIEEPVHRMAAGYWVTWPAEGAGFRDRSAVVDALCGAAGG